MERETLGAEQAPPTPPCHVCGSAEIAVPDQQVGAEVWSRLKGVTSDCKPWPRSLPVVACRACGLIQKPGTPDWLATIAQVYDAYTVYHQSSGTDQAVFDGASGDSSPRSRRLL